MSFQPSPFQIDSQFADPADQKAHDLWWSRKFEADILPKNLFKPLGVMVQILLK
jgi:hypothetical protein